MRQLCDQLAELAKVRMFFFSGLPRSCMSSRSWGLTSQSGLGLVHVRRLRYRERVTKSKSSDAPGTEFDSSLIS